MFSERSFESKIEVAPCHLSKNWKENFLQILKKTMEKKISKEFGAILSVKKLTGVKLPEVSNEKTEVVCKYIATSFNPTIDEIYTGVITIVRPQGILVENSELIRVLIQPNNIPSDYKFDPIKKVFQNSIHSYGVGDKIKFKILNIKYRPNEINCIGSIKNITPEIEEFTIDEIADDFVD